MNAAFKKAAPALPLFGDAYLADTRHLSLEEHGAYLQLLMIAWRSEGCSLPNDDARLAQMLGVSGAKWRKLKPAVMGFWLLVEGRWLQARLSKERRWVEEKSQKNSESAKQRWQNQPTENIGDGESERSSERNAPPPPPPPLKKEKATLSSGGKALPVQEIVTVFNEAAQRHGWQQVRGSKGSTPEAIILNKHQLGRLAARLQENGLDGLLEAVARADRAGMLAGPDPPSWWTFDKLISAEGFSKLMSGTYDRKLSNDRGQQPSGWGGAYSASRFDMSC